MRERDPSPHRQPHGRRHRLALWLLTLALAAAGVLLLERLVARPVAAAAQEEELETFVPTEELPADSAVSFPVDI